MKLERIRRSNSIDGEWLRKHEIDEIPYYKNNKDDNYSDNSSFRDDIINELKRVEREAKNYNSNMQNPIMIEYIGKIDSLINILKDNLDSNISSVVKYTIEDLERLRKNLEESAREYDNEINFSSFMKNYKLDEKIKPINDFVNNITIYRRKVTLINTIETNNEEMANILNRVCKEIDSKIFRLKFQMDPSVYKIYLDAETLLKSLLKNYYYLGDSYHCDKMKLGENGNSNYFVSLEILDATYKEHLKLKNKLKNINNNLELVEKECEKAKNRINEKIEMIHQKNNENIYIQDQIKNYINKNVPFAAVEDYIKNKYPEKSEYLDRLQQLYNSGIKYDVTRVWKLDDRQSSELDEWLNKISEDYNFYMDILNQCKNLNKQHEEKIKQEKEKAELEKQKKLNQEISSLEDKILKIQSEIKSNISLIQGFKDIEDIIKSNSPRIFNEYEKRKTAFQEFARSSIQIKDLNEKLDCIKKEFYFYQKVNNTFKEYIEKAKQVQSHENLKKKYQEKFDLIESKIKKVKAQYEAIQLFGLTGDEVDYMKNNNPKLYELYEKCRFINHTYYEYEYSKCQDLDKKLKMGEEILKIYNDKLELANGCVEIRKQFEQSKIDEKIARKQEIRNNWENSLNIIKEYNIIKNTLLIDYKKYENSIKKLVKSKDNSSNFSLSSFEMYLKSDGVDLFLGRNLETVARSAYNFLTDKIQGLDSLGDSLKDEEDMKILLSRSRQLVYYTKNMLQGIKEQEEKYSQIKQVCYVQEEEKKKELSKDIINIENELNYILETNESLLKSINLSKEEIENCKIKLNDLKNSINDSRLSIQEIEENYNQVKSKIDVMYSNILCQQDLNESLIIQFLEMKHISHGGIIPAEYQNLIYDEVKSKVEKKEQEERENKRKLDNIKFEFTSLQNKIKSLIQSLAGYTGLVAKYFPGNGYADYTMNCQAFSYYHISGDNYDSYQSGVEFYNTILQRLQKFEEKVNIARDLNNEQIKRDKFIDEIISGLNLIGEDSKKAKEVLESKSSFELSYLQRSVDNLPYGYFNRRREIKKITRDLIGRNSKFGLKLIHNNKYDDKEIHSQENIERASYNKFVMTTNVSEYVANLKKQGMSKYQIIEHLKKINAEMALSTNNIFDDDIQISGKSIKS